ncbi:MAG: hypothetical protein PF439_03605 [Helicobacteraceae bacterium]|jgi:hypothetical protein|nr:hypothetical protein [Helicobacteraceae bacterium]
MYEVPAADGLVSKIVITEYTMLGTISIARNQKRLELPARGF